MAKQKKDETQVSSVMLTVVLTPETFVALQHQAELRRVGFGKLARDVLTVWLRHQDDPLASQQREESRKKRLKTLEEHPKNLAEETEVRRRVE